MFWYCNCGRLNVSCGFVTFGRSRCDFLEFSGFALSLLLGNANEWMQ